MVGALGSRNRHPIPHMEFGHPLTHCRHHAGRRISQRYRCTQPIVNALDGCHHSIARSTRKYLTNPFRLPKGATPQRLGNRAHSRQFGPAGNAGKGRSHQYRPFFDYRIGDFFSGRAAAYQEYLFHTPKAFR